MIRRDRGALTFSNWLNVALVIAMTALVWHASPTVRVSAQGIQALPNGIHHLKVCTATDTNEVTKIQCADWNAALVVYTLSFGSMVRPPTIVDGDMWVEASGVSPNRIIALKICDLGVYRTLVSIQN